MSVIIEGFEDDLLSMQNLAAIKNKLKNVSGDMSANLEKINANAGGILINKNDIVTNVNNILINKNDLAAHLIDYSDPHHNFTALTANYLPKKSGTGLADSLISDDGTDITINGDLKTDRWQNIDSNLFLGVDVAGGGGLTVSGIRNIFLGKAGYSITDGHSNIKIGFEAGYYNQTGDYNFYAGYRTGKGVLNNSNSYNIGIGGLSLWKITTGTFNLGLMQNALANLTSARYVIGIGYYAGAGVTTASYGIFIGNQAGFESTGSNTVFIGYSAGRSGTGVNNVYFGANAGRGVSGNNNTGNVGIGAASMMAITTGRYDFAAGYHSGFALTTGSYNMLLGALAGSALTTAQNCIMIGYNTQGVDTTTNYQLNIGNYIKGNLSTGRIGFGIAAPTAWLHLKAGAAAVNSVPIKFTTGVLSTTPEAGALEYDGTNLYFVDSGGTRRQLAVV